MTVCTDQPFPWCTTDGTVSMQAAAPPLPAHPAGEALSAALLLIGGVLVLSVLLLRQI
jgi:hypothetical protein